MSARQLIYIVGTGHSGSTALEMFLTTGRQAVGLGEAWNAIGEKLDRLRSRRCSCGADAHACDRWRARSEWVRPYGLLPMVRRYNERCQHAL